MASKSTQIGSRTCFPTPNHPKQQRFTSSKNLDKKSTRKRTLSVDLWRVNFVCSHNTSNGGYSNTNYTLSLPPSTFSFNGDMKRPKNLRALENLEPRVVLDFLNILFLLHFVLSFCHFHFGEGERKSS